MLPNSSTLCNLASALALEWLGSSEIHQDPVIHHIPWPSLRPCCGMCFPGLWQWLLAWPALAFSYSFWLVHAGILHILSLGPCSSLLTVQLILLTLPLAWTLVFVDDVQKTPQPQSPGSYVHSPEWLASSFNSTCPKPNSIVGSSTLQQSFL